MHIGLSVSRLGSPRSTRSEIRQGHYTIFPTKLKDYLENILHCTSIRALTMDSDRNQPMLCRVVALVAHKKLDLLLTFQNIPSQ